MRIQDRNFLKLANNLSTSHKRLVETQKSKTIITPKVVKEQKNSVPLRQETLFFKF